MCTRNLAMLGGNVSRHSSIKNWVLDRIWQLSTYNFIIVVWRMEKVVWGHDEEDMRVRQTTFLELDDVDVGGDDTQHVVLNEVG